MNYYISCVNACKCNIYKRKSTKQNQAIISHAASCFRVRMLSLNAASSSNTESVVEFVNVTLLKGITKTDFDIFQANLLAKVEESTVY